jgi:hypothetical protein
MVCPAGGSSPEIKARVQTFNSDRQGDFQDVGEQGRLPARLGENGLREPTNAKKDFVLPEASDVIQAVKTVCFRRWRG